MDIYLLSVGLVITMTYGLIMSNRYDRQRQKIWILEDTIEDLKNDRENFVNEVIKQIGEEELLEIIKINTTFFEFINVINFSKTKQGKLYWLKLEIKIPCKYISFSDNDLKKAIKLEEFKLKPNKKNKKETMEMLMMSGIIRLVKKEFKGQKRYSALRILRGIEKVIVNKGLKFYKS